MRYIDFSIIDKNDPAVKEWVKKAKVRLRTLSSKTTHDDRKKYLERANFWREFKPILIKYYGNKCWYSECDLTGSYGDIDHFRPKNKSTNVDGSIILPDGYWWLAYEYLNYRMSCEICNRSYGDGGKNDIFPLEYGTLPAAYPNSDDSPMLLDPCNPDDVTLIDCDDTGAIISLTSNDNENERIRISKKVYNWNCFNTGRKKARSQCQIALKLFEVAYEKDDYANEMSIALEQLCDLTKPKTPYSSFSKRYIEFKVEDKPFKDVILSAI